MTKEKFNPWNCKENEEWMEAHCTPVNDPSRAATKAATDRFDVQKYQAQVRAFEQKRKQQ
jgi:hypothetical protein